MKTQDTQSSISGSLTILVDIVFGVVIAESFALYHNYLFHPSISPIFVGLLTVYLVTIMSWIGYHSSIAQYPYKDSGLGKARFVADLATVAMYAYLVYAVGGFTTTSVNLSYYLWGFPTIFLLYIISGQIRRKEYSPEASKQRLLFAYLFGFISMCCIYQFLVFPVLSSYLWILNWVFISLQPIVNIAYRLQRR